MVKMLKNLDIISRKEDTKKKRKRQLILKLQSSWKKKERTTGIR